jgi:hypothetical protein
MRWGLSMLTSGAYEKAETQKTFDENMENAREVTDWHEQEKADDQISAGPCRPGRGNPERDRRKVAGAGDVADLTTPDRAGEGAFGPADNIGLVRIRFRQSQ